jgi:hypothetical protein
MLKSAFVLSALLLSTPSVLAQEWNPEWSDGQIVRQTTTTTTTVIRQNGWNNQGWRNSQPSSDWNNQGWRNSSWSGQRWHDQGWNNQGWRNSRPISGWHNQGWRNNSWSTTPQCIVQVLGLGVICPVQGW